MVNDPVVIISGASRGLGEATALWLAKAGSALTLISRSADALKKVAEEVRRRGAAALAFKADVSDPVACQKAVAKTLARFGRLDALVSNAGIVEPVIAVARSDPDSWQYNISVNLLGPYYLARAAISELRKRKGRIINVSSGAATTVIENASAYCAAKAALNHFSRVLAAEETGLTVVALRPGVVDTRMQEILRGEGPEAMPSELAAYYQGFKDRGELEAPEVPARSIAWLALYGRHEFSGQFLNYDDPRITRPALEVFGESVISD